MPELDTQALEKVAEDYESLLAPALFAEWTHRIADAAKILPGQHVLDVACGTGILARTADARVGPNGSVSGVDINPAMLSVARRLSPAIDWREGSAEALPYEAGQFDAVVCQFGLMLFSEPETALGEMKRVLKRGGHLAVAVFDSIDNLPAYAAMADTYERLINKRVGDALRVPFSMGDKDQLVLLTEAAGIDSAVIATCVGTAHFPSVTDMVLSDAKGWFPFAGIHLDAQMIAAVAREAEKVLAPFQTAEGFVTFPVTAHVIIATKT